MEAPRKTGPVVLCLLDGLGVREAREGNALALAKTPVLDELSAKFARTNLIASGEAVGLSEGRAGSGALGAEAIGTGRVPRPVVRTIDDVIANKKLAMNKIVERMMWIVMDRKCRLHLFLPLSETSAHASLGHLHALLRVCEANEAQVCVHAFLEERASAPKSAGKLLDSLLFTLEGRGTIGTICGASLAMDRSGDWAAMQRVYTAIVRGAAETKETVHDALRAAYDKKQTDGKIEPVRIGDYEGIRGDYMADFAADKLVWQWIGEEAGMFLFHRPDRARQLASMFVRQNVPEDVVEFLTERGKPVRAFDEYGLLSLSDIDRGLENVLSVFPREPSTDTFSAVAAHAGLSGLRIAVAERALHVSQFFDGGQTISDALAIVAEGEQAAAVEKALSTKEQGYVIVNLAGADRAARRGDLHATIEAIETIDAQLGVIAKATEAAGGALFVVGTHGAAEAVLDDEGNPRGLHTTNPTPFIYANSRDEGISLATDGQLVDVAPTMLDVLGLAKPDAMTGRSLRHRR